MKTKHIRTKHVSFITLVVLVLATTISSFGESGIRKYENHGLVFQYPSALQAMKPASTKKIQGMLNKQLQSMGNTQVSVVALDVLLNLPTFRVMIAKERFEKVPTPGYLIEERKHFLTEAKKRGMIKSYGGIKETKIAGLSAIEFQNLDQGSQGYGSRVRILCGKNTWNFTFSGNSRESYEKYRGDIQRIMRSVSISENC